MKILDEIKTEEKSLRARIRQYQKVARQIDRELRKRPHEWGKFQSLFNYEINGIFRQIMEFEKENIRAGNEDRVYKLKKLFMHYIRKEFLRGEYIVWSLEKPYGYAGDFKIIDAIYSNRPKTAGIDRLFDNYFQMSSISVAVRNRKEDFKECLIRVLGERRGKNVRIMSLGSGPCRDIQELLGHVNNTTTQIYTRILPKHVQEVHAKYHPRAKIKGPQAAK